MNKTQLYTLIRSPIISEKTSNLAQFNQTYVFKVDPMATKNQLKKAFELAFDVSVVHLTTVVQKGKFKRFKGRIGKQASYKKAYVRLAEGQSIDFST